MGWDRSDCADWLWETGQYVADGPGDWNEERIDEEVAVSIRELREMLRRDGAEDEVEDWAAEAVAHKNFLSACWLAGQARLAAAEAGRLGDARALLQAARAMWRGSFPGLGEARDAIEAAEWDAIDDAIDAAE